jgi:hypothetical protein
MKLITTAIALTLGLSALCGPSLAADNSIPKLPVVPNIVAPAAVAVPASWSGFVLGLHVGEAANNAELGMGGLSVDGLSANEVVAGGLLGVRLHIPHSALVVGARGGYEFGFGDGFSVSAPGTSIFKAKIDNAWFVDGTVGFAMGTAMPYALVGYTQAKTGASIMGTSLNSPDLKGWRVGGGIEIQSPKSLGLGGLTPTYAIEYVYTDYSQLSFGGGALTTDVTSHAVIGRLTFQLGK